MGNIKDRFISPQSITLSQWLPSYGINSSSSLSSSILKLGRSNPLRSSGKPF